jgi:hypothetical protein
MTAEAKIAIDVALVVLIIVLVCTGLRRHDVD